MLNVTSYSSDVFGAVTLHHPPPSGDPAYSSVTPLCFEPRYQSNNALVVRIESGVEGRLVQLPCRDGGWHAIVVGT